VICFIESGYRLISHVFVWTRVLIVSSLEGLSELMSFAFVLLKSGLSFVVSCFGEFRCSFDLILPDIWSCVLVHLLVGRSVHQVFGDIRLVLTSTRVVVVGSLEGLSELRGLVFILLKCIFVVVSSRVRNARSLFDLIFPNVLAGVS